MTVGELRERLQDIPEDLEVLMYDDETSDYYPSRDVERVEVSEYNPRIGGTYYKEKHYPEFYREDFPTPPRVEAVTIT